MAKIALLVGVSEYEKGLNPLPSAAKDIEALKRVLENPDMGGFDQVQLLLNPNPMAMQEAVESLFAGLGKDDLALMFFSGHGIKDDSGRLYLATPTTRKSSKGDLVKASAVPASFVQDVMSNSRSKRQVVILDCCFSGAFAEGMTAKDDGTVDLQTQLGGEGRAVLTSSTSTQYSFEQKDSDLSIYTQYVVEGIESGAADMDNDGQISVDELHEYAQKKVQETAPAMKPKMYVTEEGFRIRLAQVQLGDPKLAYRKEVEAHSGQGKISSLGRRILDDLRANLGLSTEETQLIEEEVLKPYRDYQVKLQRYEQAFSEANKLENPLGKTTRDELTRYQRVLGLRTEDVQPIERKYLVTSKPQLSQPLLWSGIAGVAASVLFLVGPWLISQDWPPIGTGGNSPSTPGQNPKLPESPVSPISAVSPAIPDQKPESPDLPGAQTPPADSPPASSSPTDSPPSPPPPPTPTEDSTLNRQSVTLQYFPKDQDPAILQSQLKELGFKAVIVGTPKVSSIPSNSIWFGNGVKIEDVKEVAYIMIQAGLKVQIIRHFAKGRTDRDGMIQIGADEKHQDSPALSIADIRKAEEFPWQELTGR